MNRRRFISLAAGAATAATVAKPLMALAPPSTPLPGEWFAAWPIEPTIFYCSPEGWVPKARQCGITYYPLLNMHRELFAESLLTDTPDSAKVDFEMKQHTPTRTFTTNAAQPTAQGNRM